MLSARLNALEGYLAELRPFAERSESEFVAEPGLHSFMRTTLTLDNDVAAALSEKAERSVRPFKQIVNETLRAGMEAALHPPQARRYVLRPAHLAALAVEHRCPIASTDNDFKRFAGIELVNPLRLKRAWGEWPAGALRITNQMVICNGAP